MDDPNFFHQWPLVSDLAAVSFGSLYEDPHHAFSLQPEPDHERAPESRQYESNKPSKHLRSSTSTSTFHFIDDTNPEGIWKPKTEAWTLDFPFECVGSESSFGNKNHVLKPCQGAKRVSTNTRPKDNVLAERKRREILTQRFIDLSALVPDLKKVLSLLQPILIY